MSIELKFWKLGFLSCGELGFSLVYPLIKKGILNPENIFVSERQERVRKMWDEELSFRVHTFLTPCQVASEAEIIFVGFDAKSVEDELKIAIIPSLSRENTFRNKLIISFIPGMTCDELANKISEYDLPRNTLQILRVVPYMLSSVGEALILYCRDKFLIDSGAESVIEFFSCHGMVEEINESYINIASGPALYGPAFVYLMMEAMADGAVRTNMPRDLAMKFIAQIFAGAAKIVLKTGKHPGVLKDEVCIPKGAAITGVHELEIGCVRAALMNAVDAATKRLNEQ